MQKLCYSDLKLWTVPSGLKDHFGCYYNLVLGYTPEMSVSNNRSLLRKTELQYLKGEPQSWSVNCDGCLQQTV